MVLSKDRLLVLGALGAVGVAVAVAVVSAMGAPVTTSGVAAAHATVVRGVTRTLAVGGATVTVQVTGGGNVCYRAPHVSSCVAKLGDDKLSYATGRVGAQTVIAGVAGPHVRAVIARLSHRGTVWPEFRDGAFYAVLPRGHALRAVVKVLAGGRRVAFPATA